MSEVRFPFDTYEWEIKDGHQQNPPIEWQGDNKRLVLILAWVDGTGTPRTLWARRK